MATQTPPTATTEVDLPLNDLGPLAWVLDELRKAVGNASRALRRHVQEAANLTPTERAAMDAGQLRVARQQLHQAAGATDMVGQGAVAMLLRAMEAAVQLYVQQPQRASDAAATAIEQAGFGLLQYLDAILAGRPVSPVVLFPQFRDVQALLGNDRAHPADLWPMNWRWQDPALPVKLHPLVYDPQPRAHFEQGVLRVVKSRDISAARKLRELSLHFAAAQTAMQPRVFWKLCAAFFEAQVRGLTPDDLHVKRLTSRILQQYSALVRGELGVSDRLALDLLFFIAQARPEDGVNAPILRAVREAFGVHTWTPVDYESSPFGRFDPALLAQARKRIGSVKEAWSSVAGGETVRLRGLTDQFGLVADSLVKLHPPSAPLGQALVQAADATVRSGEAPAPALAMEVATAVMYLEAMFEELDPADVQLVKRTTRLAQRIQAVQAGGRPEPLEPWIEDLYHRVSDRQTMGSVVGELRGSLDEIERVLDQYFRDPSQSGLLAQVPAQMAQMRGVLSVLGLDQAVKAVVRMRETVEKLLDTEVDAEHARESGLFNGMGNNLGALGLLFDMLSYQPVLAKRLFVFNENLGELQPLMGRMGAEGLLQPQLPMELAGVSRAVAVPERRSADRRAPIVDSAAAIDGPSIDTELGSLRQFQPTDFGDSRSVGMHAELSDSGFDHSRAAPVDSRIDSQLHGITSPDMLEFPGALLADPRRDAPVVAAPMPAEPPVDDATDLDEEDLLGVFLEEASDVVRRGHEALKVLSSNPAELDEQTALRRAFHTLKGSSRMVGLADFGEAAWAVEQLHNAWLAERRASTPDLRALSDQALQGFAAWAQAISGKNTQGWSSKPFRRSADTLRLENRFIPVAWPGAPEPQLPVSAAPEPLLAAADVSGTDTRVTADELAKLAATLSPPPQAPADPLPAVPEAPVDLPLALDPEPVPVPVSVPVQMPVTEPEPDLTLDFNLEPESPASALGTAPTVIAGLEPVGQEVLIDDLPLLTDLDLSAYTSTPAPQPQLPAAGDEPSLVLPEAVPMLEAPPADAAALPVPEAQADALAVPEAGDLTDDEILLQFPELADSLVAPLPVAASPTGPEFIEAIDMDALGAVAGGAEPAIPHLVDAAVHTDVLAFASLPDVAPEPLAEVTQTEDPGFELQVPDDDQYKRIGDLRIGLPLYNVYLNEADEWSRRLQVELSEWALELHRVLPDSTVALAHSLAGSSATVGFTALSDLARQLEHAMQRTQLRGLGDAQEASVFTAAADDIRRLLHQFAAGFLKAPDAEVVRSLDELLQRKEELPSEGAGDMRGALGADVDADLGAHGDAADQDVLSSSAVVAADLHGMGAPGDAPEAPTPLGSRFADLVPTASTSPASHVHDDAPEEERDIDAVDALDPDLFPVFEEEAQELLPQLAGALRQWAARPENHSARAEALRVLHTLKGSARLAGAMRLGERAHRMESAVEHLPVESASAPALASGFDGLLARFDLLQASFDALRDQRMASEQADAAAAPDLIPTELAPAAAAAAAAVAIHSAEAGLVDDSVGAAGAQSPSGAAHDAAAQSLMQLAPQVPVSASVAPVVAAPLKSVTVAAPGNAVAKPTGQAVRIRSQLLDRLVNQTGEVMMTRARLEAGVGQLRSSLSDLTDNLDRLRQQLRDLELQAELQMQSRMALAKESDRTFDPLEFDRFTRVQELTRMMAESVNDVATVQRGIQRTVDNAEADLVAQARQARELQRDLLRTRMVEFDTIVERLYRVVRQASKECDKQVKLDIVAGTVEMDRGVLDRMTPAFEHLLRNAVVHGIETPEQRVAAGKPAQGSITVQLGQEGNDVSVQFSDDGAGLNVERIREKAVAQGLVPAGQALTPEETTRLIFMPGFSTATQVTELAGRGIGMDVVRSDVLALGGRVESASQGGRGTQFTLVLPLTTAVTQVVMLRAGRLSFGVPGSVVELVRRVSPQELERAYQDGQYAFGNDMLPFFWSGSLLQLSGVSEEPQGRTSTVVVLRSAQQRIALHVDEVLGNQEVVVKNLGPQLSRLPGLSGMTVLASGAVVLIYNPVALASVYGDRARAFQTEQRALVATRAPDAPIAPRAADLQHVGVPLVLVVDDSITVRRVTQRLLQREGYRVALAVDGVQALDKLRDETPTVVLSDIEMPRMDGFELARNIRSNPAWQGMPIIMITSRIAEKHREHAREIGVDHYLGKPYSEEELLSLIRRYAAEATAYA